jgi:hypothetical protein
MQRHVWVGRCAVRWHRGSLVVIDLNFNRVAVVVIQEGKSAQDPSADVNLNHMTKLRGFWNDI